MDFNSKLLQIRNEISDKIKEIKTEEDKKQFAEQYGFDMNEVEDVLSKHKQWRRSNKIQSRCTEIIYEQYEWCGLYK